MGLRHVLSMAFTHSDSGFEQPDQRRIALFDLVDGPAFSVELSAGCEKFVGRFARLPELRTADHVIRFCDPETATGSARD